MFFYRSLFNNRILCATYDILIGCKYVSSRVILDPVAQTLPEFQDLRFQNHDEAYKFSIKNPNEFWSRLARSRLRWYKEFDTTADCDFNNARFKWFIGGQLNATVNCLDRHIEYNPETVALIWEKDEPGTQEKLTYRELHRLTCQIANVLRLECGVKRGSRVAIYLPTSIIAVATMLACARIGAIHSVVFAGFSSEALAARINDAQAEVLVTVDQGVRGGKIIELKKTVNEALRVTPCVKHVLVATRTGNNTFPHVLDINLESAIQGQSQHCDPVRLDSEDALFMLYTSGSTGKPKGLVHSIAGYLLYASLTHKLVFNFHFGDIFACVADIGWITGHTYVIYGPLLNGATTVLFESVPTYPDPGRYWEMVERLKITHFYAAPTAIRLLLRYDSETFVEKYNRSTLKVLGSVGEPINHDAWEWYNRVIGEERCMVVDTWWQTETGGICLTPCPADPGANIKPAMAQRPFYGIVPVIFDDNNKPIDGAGYGALCLAKPWPGMARTIFNDHQRYFDTYFKQYPGFYFTGDGAHRDEDGEWCITGRIDDVINVSGHRLGTAEIEDVLDHHQFVSECAVVGFPHDIKGEALFAFVTLKDHVDGDEHLIKAELCNSVKTAIASYAVPDKIMISNALPKTRSGKIMRRILRKIARGDVSDLGDTSTLSDPTVVAELLDKHKLLSKQ